MSISSHARQHATPPESFTNGPLTPLSSEEEEITFLEEVLPWLDSQDYVHRYAYFMASEGSLISGRVLSRDGETFASFV